MTKNIESIQDTVIGISKEDAYRILEIINSWISNIDTKVSFALTLSGALIGFIFSIGLPNIFRIIGEISKLKELSGGVIIGAIFICLLYITSLISVIYFMLAITARVKNHNNTQSIFFFGSIGKMELSDYKTNTNKINQQEILEDLKEQIHTNSMICNKKARYYNTGIRFLLVTVILWFICTVFRLI